MLRNFKEKKLKNFLTYFLCRIKFVLFVMYISKNNKIVVISSFSLQSLVYITPKKSQETKIKKKKNYNTYFLMKFIIC